MSGPHLRMSSRPCAAVAQEDIEKASAEGRIATSQGHYPNQMAEAAIQAVRKESQARVKDI